MFHLVNRNLGWSVSTPTIPMNGSLNVNQKATLAIAVFELPPVLWVDGLTKIQNWI
jgi:hypothetical protein